MATHPTRRDFVTQLFQGLGYASAGLVAGGCATTPRDAALLEQRQQIKKAIAEGNAPKPAIQDSRNPQTISVSEYQKQYGELPPQATQEAIQKPQEPEAQKPKTQARELGRSAAQAPKQQTTTPERTKPQEPEAIERQRPFQSIEI